MKKLLPLTLFSLFMALFFDSALALDKPNPLLVCLGKEELKIHKSKIEGPIYKLNQELINQLARANNVSVRMDVIREVCQ